MKIELIPGYWLKKGSTIDRAKLVQFMQRTYEELYPQQEFSHLAQTIEQYFSNQTPVWWVEGQEKGEEIPYKTPINFLSYGTQGGKKIACLWLGNAVDQVSGKRHTHIFLLYVNPVHRRQGIGTALMNYAENWAKQKGDSQIGLQVFVQNQPALNLYHKLGYQSRSLWMIKSWDQE